jgi:uncharacterized RDD family membrane protein YckC
MKCPKCGYLGFETTDRCRNCGYDFSLAERPPAAKELALRDRGEREEPLADFDLSGHTPPPAGPDAPSSFDLSLDAAARPGATPTSPLHAEFLPQPTPSRPDPKPRDPAPLDAVPPDPTSPAAAPATAAEPPPMLAAPRPAGQPLAVRRATPEMPRPRSRPTTRPARAESLPLDLDGAAATEPVRVAPGAQASPGTEERAGVVARLAAALIDIVLLGAIDAAVLVFTLRATGLDMTAADLAVLSPVPLGGFFVLLAFGYLVGFTAGGGQTIGKMALGLRVLSDDGTQVDLAGAVLRSLGALAAVLTLGLLYVPVLITSDRRAVHDRLSGTRVVKDRR